MTYTKPAVRTCKRGHERVPSNLRPNGTCIPCEPLRAAEARRARGVPERVVDPLTFPCGHPRADNTRPGRYDCATCHRARERQRYRANPEQARAAAAKWRQEHPERFNATIRRWREENRERHLAMRRAIDRRKRLGAKDPETIEYLEVIAEDPCVYCGDPAEAVDHIVAASRGGANHWSNYAPACGPSNNRKRAKPLLTFLLQEVSG